MWRDTNNDETQSIEQTIDAIVWVTSPQNTDKKRLQKCTFRSKKIYTFTNNLIK